MADLLNGVSPQGLSSALPFTVPGGRDPRTLSEDPGKSFSSLLRLSQSEKGEASPAGLPSRSGETGPSGGDKMDKLLYEQCQALEGFLVKTLLSSMRSTVQKSGLIDEGFAGKMYEDMLYDEYAKDFSKNAGFGFADLAYRELKRSDYGFNGVV